MIFRFKDKNKKYNGIEQNLEKLNYLYLSIYIYIFEFRGAYIKFSNLKFLNK